MMRFYSPLSRCLAAVYPLPKRGKLEYNIYFKAHIPMSRLAELYLQAEQYGAEKQLPYAGALPPADALLLLELDPSARLVDVRTRAELDWIGRPRIAEAQYIHLEWTRYPGSVPNPDFIVQMQELVQADTPVLFLCRSAVRSKASAIAVTRAGFSRAFDLLEGFEGDRDANGHRKTVGGWCFRGLPWIGA